MICILVCQLDGFTEKSAKIVQNALCLALHRLKVSQIRFMRVFENSDICNTSSHRRCLIIRIRAIRC